MLVFISYFNEVNFKKQTPLVKLSPVFVNENNEHVLANVIHASVKQN